jgi:hypothetical protein
MYQAYNFKKVMIENMDETSSLKSIAVSPVKYVETHLNKVSDTHY